MITFFISKLISSFLGFLYPAYMSFKALQTKDEKDDAQWLTYWVAFASILTIEYSFEFILQYVPFYFELKSFVHFFCKLMTIFETIFSFGFGMAYAS